MPYCTNCGEEVNESQSFCTNCGQELKSEKPANNQQILRRPNEFLRKELRGFELWKIISIVIVATGLLSMYIISRSRAM